MLLPLDVLSLVFLSLSASPLASIPSVSAAFLNVTVDDTDGDPFTGNQISYQPPGAWQLGQTCTTCTAHPSPSKAYNGTWHDSTSSNPGPAAPNEPVNATLSFQGVAVYVFCILTRSFTSPLGNSDMSFFIDNTPVGTFQLPPTGNPTYLYNVPVYVNESLPPGQHTITVVNGQPNGNTSLTLLDYIVYTRDNSTAGELVSSLTPTQPATSTAVSSPTAMAQANSTTTSSSSSRRTIIIAVVASLAAILALIVLTAAIIYCGRRRAKAKANACDPSQNGVISPDAVPIDQEDPNTSGWVEGTWGEDEDPSQGRVLRAASNGRRKRGPENPSASNSSYPNTPSTRSLNKSLPSVSNIQTTRLPYSRPEVISPTSSFGNLGSAPPDSATFLISTTSPPPRVPPIPPVPPVPALPPARPRRLANESDTFLDMEQSFVDTNLSTLSSQAAHPFATAHAYNPPYLRQRADTHTTTTTTTTIPPPSASSSALAAATRGYAAASGTTRKRSGSDLEREQQQQQQQQQRANAHSRKRSGSDLSNSNYVRVPAAPASPPRRAGSDLEVNYARGGPVVNPLAPSAPRHQRSGSDLESNYNYYQAAPSMLQSPNTVVSTLPSTTTSPTSMTTLMPKRVPSPSSRGQVKEKSSASSLSTGAGHGHGQRVGHAAAPRKVDPVDPSLQPLIARQASERERERERTGVKAQEQQAQSQPQLEEEVPVQSPNRSGRRGGMVMSDRDRQRFGFLDVPQDASDSRPPSYREADR